MKKLNMKKKNKSFCSNEPFEREQKSFNEFWNAYPRKQKKRDAIKAWSKVDPTLYDKIIVDVKNRIRVDVQWQNKQFIPLPATYLNAECWNDEIILEKPPTISRKPNEPRSTVPWANPAHARIPEWKPGNPDYDRVNGINSQGVKADEHRGDQSRGRDLQHDQTAQASRPPLVGSNEPGGSRTGGVKKASTFLLPERHNRGTT